jgi:acetoin utilization protein AcuB
MFEVKDFMVKDVITTEKDAKISEVLDLMRYHKIHRIPVVDENDKLVGLITEGMIAGQNSPATSLSIYELNYLLSKTAVKTVMIRKVISIHENDLMEEAAEKLLKHDIGCLPVINEDGKVVGILTQNDIFKAFLDVLGWNKETSRLIISTPEGVGRLQKMTSIFAQANVNIANLGVYKHDEDNVAYMIVRVDGQNNLDSVIDMLEKEDFHVLEYLKKEPKE